MFVCLPALVKSLTWTLLFLSSVSASTLSFQVTMKNWDDETSQMLPFLLLPPCSDTESET